MKQLMKYQRYTYVPHRGNHNLFNPVELANLAAVDRRINKMEPRIVLNQRKYLERHRQEINARERERRRKKRAEKKRMDADAPERADHIGEVTEMVTGKDGWDG